MPVEKRKEDKGVSEGIDLFSFRYPAASGIVGVPVVFVKAADHDTTGSGGMNKVIIGEIHTHMGDAPAVYMKEYQVPFYGIGGALDAHAGAELLHCSAHKVHAIYFFIQFLCKSGAVDTFITGAAQPVVGAIPFIYELV